MPKYKLTYFNARGKAEISRLLFAAKGIEYEDVRINAEDWPEYKAKTPLGQLPLLEIDGVQYIQSIALHRYLATIFGFVGDNPLQNLHCDSIVNTCDDLLMLYMFDVAVATYFLKDAEKEKQAKERLLNEGLPRFLPVLDKMVSDYGDGSGLSVGSKLTWADFALHVGLQSSLNWFPDMLEKYPNLSKQRKLIDTHPSVKGYLETRPKTTL